MAINKVWATFAPKADWDTYIGQPGEIWYDPVTGQLRLHNSLPGGIPLSSWVNIVDMPEVDLTQDTIDAIGVSVGDAISSGLSINVGEVELGAASLAALENITIDGGTLTGVTIDSGEIALDAATITALTSGTITNVTIDNFPTIQTVDGEVALDAATLAALENINATISGIATVSGTVELGATSLAALEDINTAISGEVALDAATLAALENITVSGNVGVTGTVSVDNFPTIQTVDGTIALDSATLAALESVSLNGGTIELGSTTVTALLDGPQTITGTVSLSAASLTALEDVNVSGTVALDAATLTALENVTVDGEVEIGSTSLASLLSGTQMVELTAATLAALENITIDGGTVELGSTSLTALENVTIDAGTIELGSASLAALENVTLDGGTLSNVTIASGNITVDGEVALDAATLAALENITIDSGNVTVAGTVAVSNFPATQTVDGTIALDSATITALTSTSGTVALDAPTLAALEDINATVTGTVSVDNFPATQIVDGTVELGATSLAALEDITIDNGTINLSATTLAALETTELGATTLAALENISVTGTVSVDNFPAVQAVSGTVGLDTTSLDALETVSLSQSTLDALEVISIDEQVGNRDAFGRTRISTVHTLFDSKQIHSNQPLYWDDQEVSGSGTSSVYSNARSSSTLNVTASIAGRRVRQTKQRFNYQPGKSQLILMTGLIANSGTGITGSMGYYDDSDGIFVQSNEGVLNFTIRSSASGSITNDVVTQANWNGDKLDGTGASGTTLDPGKAQIFWIDIEWLGVGSVRCGFIIDGQYIICHTFYHANIVTGVYMSTPNLPLRYEIENDGTGGASYIEAICSTVMAEGGVVPLGQIHYISNGDLGGVNITTAGNIYAQVGVRLKSDCLDVQVDLLSMSMMNLSNDSFEWLLILNPTVAGTFTYADEPNTCMQYALGDNTNTVTGGYKIAGGFQIAGASSGSLTANLENAVRLGSLIDGTRDQMVLCVRPLSSNSIMYAGMNWRELT